MYIDLSGDPIWRPNIMETILWRPNTVSIIETTLWKLYYRNLIMETIYIVET